MSGEENERVIFAPSMPMVEVKRKRQNLILIFENDHSKLKILVYSRLRNQRIWPLPNASLSTHVVAAAMPMRLDLKPRASRRAWVPNTLEVADTNLKNHKKIQR